MSTLTRSIAVAFSLAASLVPVAAAQTTYSPFNCPCSGITEIQGIRGVTSDPTKVLIAGTLTGTASGVPVGLVYRGPVTGAGSSGDWFQLSFPSSTTATVTVTSLYGPADLGNGNIRVVGAYQTSQGGSHNRGCMYQGPLNGSGTWTAITPNGGNTNNVFVHSTMGKFAVGNYDIGGLDNGYAFVYDIESQQYFSLAAPGAYTTTAYGIWHDGANHYTIAGGYSMPEATKLSQGFLVDWNGETHQASNWRTYNFGNNSSTSIITHFEGINANESGGYNLATDFVTLDGGIGAGLARIERLPDGTLGPATWHTIAYPGAKVTSANTVYLNKILGVFSSGGAVSSYIANVVNDPPPSCPEDLNGDGRVDGADLARLLSKWGVCQ